MMFGYFCIKKVDVTLAHHKRLLIKNVCLKLYYIDLNISLLLYFDTVYDWCIVNCVGDEATYPLD